MLAENCVGHLAVRDYLYRAVVVLELFLGDDVRVVAMHRAIDAYDALHNTRNRTQVVRYNHYGHPLAQALHHAVELMLEAVIDKVCRLVQDE